MEYARKSYLESMAAGIGSGQVKIVTGIRRCGKSYLLDTIFKRWLMGNGVAGDHIVQMDFDGLRNQRYRDPQAFLDYVDENTTDPGTYYLLLDEVQLLESFPEVLNDLIRQDNLDVFVTGSNARLLSRDVVTEFRGRGEEIPLRPLSFSEFMECYSGDKRDGYAEYATYGGLPAAALREGAKRKADYLDAIMREALIRDIVDRNGVKGVDDFNDLLDVLCSNIGGLTNPTKISNTFRSEKRSTLSRQTVEQYIGYMEDSFILEKAVRYDIKGRGYIGAGAKYYMTDLGLRNVRTNFRQMEGPHILENVIYNELRGRGYRVDVGVVPAQARDKDGKAKRVTYEVDFVCNRGSDRCYVQPAFDLPTQEKADQEHEPLRRIDDSFRKVIVTKEGFAPHYDERGVLLMNVYDFLLDPLSLERY